MSAGRNKRTPLRVQVFYFEKKALPSRAVADTIPTMEAVTDPFGTFLPAEAPTGYEPTVKMDVPFDALALQEDISRRVTPKMPQPRRLPPGLLKGGAAADPEPPRARRKKRRSTPSRTRRQVPSPSPAPEPPTPEGGSAEQALEYHRLMLKSLAARADAQARGLIDRAIFGHTLFARGRMREAQVVFESIVAGEPDEAFPYTMLGAVYLAQGDDGRALALFDAALTMDPADPAALVNRAEIRLQRRQPKLALKDLERAIEGARRGPAPFLARAKALVELARSMVR